MFHLYSAKSPCANCNDRYLACHSECEKYKEFKIKLDLRRNSRDRERRAEWAVGQLANGKSKGVKE